MVIGFNSPSLPLHTHTQTHIHTQTAPFLLTYRSQYRFLVKCFSNKIFLYIKKLNPRFPQQSENATEHQGKETIFGDQVRSYKKYTSNVLRMYLHVGLGASFHNALLQLINAVDSTEVEHI